jgi:hypothetical protein
MAAESMTGPISVYFRNDTGHWFMIAQAALLDSAGYVDLTRGPIHASIKNTIDEFNDWLLQRIIEWLTMTQIMTDPEVEVVERPHCNTARRLNQNMPRRLGLLRRVREIRLTESFRIRTSASAARAVASNGKMPPHDRRGHICHGRKEGMQDCEHVWIRETETRERCIKCSGAKWWRRSSRINGESTLPPNYSLKPPRGVTDQGTKLRALVPAGC